MSVATHRFCVAPMIDWTDSHCRVFHRLLSKHARLYTEMITANAILHGDQPRLLAYDSSEHPLALQLGGADPKMLAVAASIGEGYGYDEINLNVGCPSDRVQQGRFGACLMAEPALVADCIANMQAKVTIPVTVKSRIGIDDCEPETFLPDFISTIRQTGCRIFIIHARKAWLKGLSPKENREIPPLDYPLVYQLKKTFSDCTIILNGGIKTLEEAQQQLQQVDGVMLGRAAYQNPYLLSQVDSMLFQANEPIKSRLHILQEFLAYIDTQRAKNIPLHTMTRHILGLWHGEPGARVIRQFLSNPHLSSEEKLELLRKLL